MPKLKQNKIIIYFPENCKKYYLILLPNESEVIKSLCCVLCSHISVIMKSLLDFQLFSRLSTNYHFSPIFLTTMNKKQIHLPHPINELFTSLQENHCTAKISDHISAYSGYTSCRVFKMLSYSAALYADKL